MYVITDWNIVIWVESCLNICMQSLHLPIFQTWLISMLLAKAFTLCASFYHYVITSWSGLSLACIIKCTHVRMWLKPGLLNWTFSVSHLLLVMSRHLDGFNGLGNTNETLICTWKTKGIKSLTLAVRCQLFFD